MDPAANLEAEREEAFLALPGEVRERIVIAESERVERWEELRGVASKRWRRPVREGALLLLCFIAPFAGFELAAMLSALLTGAALGLFWHFTRANQLVAIATSIPVYMLLMLAIGSINIIVFLCAPFPLGAIAGILALQREEASSL